MRAAASCAYTPPPSFGVSTQRANLSQPLAVSAGGGAISAPHRPATPVSWLEAASPAAGAPSRAGAPSDGGGQEASSKEHHPSIDCSIECIKGARVGLRASAVRARCSKTPSGQMAVGKIVLAIAEYWLLSIVYWLLAVGCWILAIVYWQSIGCYPLSIGGSCWCRLAASAPCPTAQAGCAPQAHRARQVRGPRVAARVASGAHGSVGGGINYGRLAPNA
jgi:hypothetical protein